MRIGFIGAGAVAQTMGRYFADGGHDVILSGRKAPSAYAEQVAKLGPRVRTASPREAAEQDFVVLAVPWTEAPAALSAIASWNGRVLIDSTNAFASLSPRRLADLGGRTSSEIVADLAPGATVLKAFNNIPMSWINKQTTDARRTVLFISGDAAEPKSRLAAALEQMGFSAIDLGGLVEGGRLVQLGGPLNGLHLQLINRF